MKIVAINAGPRKGWNTDMLISEALEGALERGAETEYISLYDLDKFTGCKSMIIANITGHILTLRIKKRNEERNSLTIYKRHFTQGGI